MKQSRRAGVPWVVSAELSGEDSFQQTGRTEGRSERALGRLEERLPEEGGQRFSLPRLVRLVPTPWPPSPRLPFSHLFILAPALCSGPLDFLRLSACCFPPVRLFLATLQGVKWPCHSAVHNFSEIYSWLCVKIPTPGLAR